MNIPMRARTEVRGVEIVWMKEEIPQSLGRPLDTPRSLGSTPRDGVLREAELVDA